jgi:hypothetical protein
MAAYSIAAFVNRHIMALVEQPRRRHSGNTGADDRDLFCISEPALHRPTLPGRLRSASSGLLFSARQYGRTAGLDHVISIDPKGDAGRIFRHAGRNLCRTGNAATARGAKKPPFAGRLGAAFRYGSGAGWMANVR